MTDTPDLAARVAQLESQMDELRVMHDLVLRLLSTSRPLARVLEQYGANETQEQALYRLLDFADPDFSAGSEPDFAPLVERFGELNHAERALAAHAMINRMARADRASARQTRRVFLHLLRRRPGMIPKAAWRALPAALLR